MQYLLKLWTVFVILLVNHLYTDVPYFMTNGFILIPISAQCKVVNSVQTNLGILKNSENLSQESPTDTLEGDRNLEEEYKESFSDEYGSTDFMLPTRLGTSPGVDFKEDRDPYNLLCFAEVPELGEPLQLVYPNEDHTQLLVDHEVLKVLEQVPKPVYPVALIGSVNSGKSFLLNLINDNHLCNTCLKPSKSDGPASDPFRYANFDPNKRFLTHDKKKVSTEGFKEATTPEPETFGIWVYSEPLKISRRKLQERLRENAQKSNFSYYSLKNVSSSRDSNQFSRLSRMREDDSVDVDKDDSLGDLVNVIFFDVEGFNSHKNVFKYDEALFSVVSSVCSEVIYLSNRTLNSADLQLMEELIKSSLLSKISNLYTMYSEMGEVREDREEVFQYFLKMFENKNLTFLVSEYNYSSEQAFENLVNLLKAPKRDLSLHETFLYHNRYKTWNQTPEREEDLAKRLKLGTDNKLQKVPKSVGPETQGNVQNPSNGQTTLPAQTSDRYVCTTATLKMDDVMFTSFGYIFHMLFNSVNLAVLPSTSRNPFLVNPLLNKPVDGVRVRRVDPTTEEDYLDHLSNFKFDLFLRSTKNPLVKNCVLDGVNTTCYMTGRDLADMVRLTLNTLSLNKFFNLATNIGPIEGLSKIDYKDAFDEFFRVFRSTRLLMIKNDLYETYRTILKKYTQGDTFSDKRDASSRNFTGQSVPRREQMPSTRVYRAYSQKLKEQLLQLLVKNFENETFSEDFNKIKQDLLQGFDKVAALIDEELTTRIRDHCTDVADSLFKGYSDRVGQLRLPVVPSRLKFLHQLPQEFKNRFSDLVDHGEFQDPYRNQDDPDSNSPDTQVAEDLNDQLSYDFECLSVFETYLTLLEEKNAAVFKRNEELIDNHFNSVFNRALGHFRTKFSELPQNYECPLDQSLKRSVDIIREAKNVMVAHLGEFHALDFMVENYSNTLRARLEQELEEFKKTYAQKCNEKIQTIESHYLDNYRVRLNNYAPLPTNPENLYKYHEYLKYVSEREFLRVSCATPTDIHEATSLLQEKLAVKYNESLVDNVNEVAAGLKDEFAKFDEYLLKEVPKCKFYPYFYYNAKRYANYNITGNLIYDTLKLDKVSKDPLNSLGLAEVLFNPENANPTTSVNFDSDVVARASSSSSRSSYDIEIKELSRMFLQIESDKLQKKFVEGVTEYYLKNNVKKFKKLFIRRLLRSVVLVSSLTLLGLSLLSFTLAKNGFAKLFFSGMGFMSYVFLVGKDTTKANLKWVVHVVNDIIKKAILELLKVIKALLNKLLDLVLSGITLIFLNIGYRNTFLVGFVSCVIFYISIKILLFYRRIRKRRDRANRPF